jgi:hypothetical protein
MMNPVFIQQDINNGALSFYNAMPQKDFTSDGNASFEMGRKVFVKTHPVMANQQPHPQNHQKKWLGNRDSSQVTANRRNHSIGKGSVNTAAATKFSFTTYRDVNTVNDALTRCRSGGSCVPAKCRARKTNAPTPSFAPAAPKHDIGIKYPVLYH